MKKIPTLFVRDPQDMKRVLPEVNPGCEWVLNGEGVATRKYDGTCVLARRVLGSTTGDVEWFARREVKPGKTPPPSFIQEDHDPATGKTVGWEPAAQSSWAKYLDEAVVNSYYLGAGTYELCGPKVNGNPEGYSQHVLVSHASAVRVPEVDSFVKSASESASVEYLHDALGEILAGLGFEGIVWHHPDGRMAKLKARDFPA